MMNRSFKTTEFDRTLIAKARERSEANHLQSVNDPSPATVFDADLIQRAKSRSDASHVRANEIRSQKLQFNTTLQKNWSKTERDKRHRIIRDLQFELATSSIADLRKAQSNELHREAQVGGIAAFEMSLFKSGLGGNEDEGGTLGISYENGEAFLERIEDRNRRSFPVDAEISKFVTQLKARTKEKKVARHEKGRRKRKTAASQTNPATMEDSQESSPEKDEEADNDSGSSDGEVTMDIEAIRNSRREMAEDSIRIFAEQSRMQHDDNNGGNAAIGVIDRQRQHRISKNQGVHDTCQEIVGQLLSMVDYGDDTKSKCVQAPLKIKDTSKLTTRLLDFAGEQSGSPSSADGPLSATGAADLMLYDSWLPYTALAANVGQWTFCGNISNDALEDNRESNVTKNAEVSHDCVSEKMSLFLQSTRSKLEALLTISCGGADSDISLTLNADEHKAFYQTKPNPLGVLLILGGGDGADICAADLLRAIDWLGGSLNVEVWDVAAAVDFGRKIALLLEGKNPTISYSTLLDIFLTSPADAFAVDRSEGCSRSSKSIPLSAKALKVASEIADISARILHSMHAAASPAPSGGKNESKSKAAATPPTAFSDATFGVLLGQALWLRNYMMTLYVESLLASEEDISTLQEPRPHVRSCFTPVVLATCCVHSNVSAADEDSVIFALALDWFMRGGTKEIANDINDDTDGRKLLREALALDGEAAPGVKKGKDKPPPKGKAAVSVSVVEVEPMGPSLLSGILRIASDRVNSSSSVEASIDGDLKTAEQRLSESTKSALNAATVTDPLNSPIRCFVANNSKLPRPATHIPEDRAAAENVLVETTAQSSILYLRLNNRDGVSDTPGATPAPSTDSKQIDFTSGLSASETLVSFILTRSKNYCAEYLLPSPVQDPAVVELPQPDEEMNVTIDDFSKVLATIAQRRTRLSCAEQIWLLHIAKTNIINMSSVARVLHQCVESRDFEVQLMGALLMAYGTNISALQDEWRVKEAEMVKCLKLSDSRFKDTCLYAQQKLSSSSCPPAPQMRHKRGGDGESRARILSRGQVDIITSDCVCRLGDIIDDRHMRWVSSASSQRAVLNDNMKTFKLIIKRIASSIVEAITATHACKLKAGQAVSRLLIDAQYTAVPWVLPHSGSKSTRRAMDVRRDRLKSAALQMAACCGDDSPEGMEQANNGDGSDLWSVLCDADKSVRLADTAGGGEGIFDSIADELFAESLESSFSLLSGLQEGLKDLEYQLVLHNESVEAMIINRFHYEHALLAQWASSLQDSLVKLSATTQRYSNSILSSYYFDVVDDTWSDNVPSKVGLNALELEDLTLCLSSLRSIAACLSTILGDPNEMLLEDACTDLLILSVNEMEDRSLSPAWRQKDRLKHLVRVVLHGADGRTDPSIAEVLVCRKSFVQSITSILLLSAIPVTPSGTFIRRLGDLFKGKHGAKCVGSSSTSLYEMPRQTLASFQERVVADQLLGTIWYDDMAYGGAMDTVIADMGNALAAVAYSCQDSDGNVVIEQVMLVLCSSPRRTPSFEKHLLLHADTLSDYSPLYDNVRSPSLLSEGIYKALSVAARIGVDLLPSDGDCGRSCITADQMQWLVDSCPSKLPLACVAALKNEEIFRPIFAPSLEGEDQPSSSSVEVPDVPLRTQDGDVGFEAEAGPLQPDLNSLGMLEPIPPLYSRVGFSADIIELVSSIQDKEHGTGDIPFCV